MSAAPTHGRTCWLPRRQQTARQAAAHAFLLRSQAIRCCDWWMYLLAKREGGRQRDRQLRIPSRPAAEMSIAPSGGCTRWSARREGVCGPSIWQRCQISTAPQESAAGNRADSHRLVQLNLTVRRGRKAVAPGSRDVYGSQWWTYLLVGAKAADNATRSHACLPALQPRCPVLPMVDVPAGEREVGGQREGQLHMRSRPAGEISAARSGSPPRMKHAALIPARYPPRTPWVNCSIPAV